MKRPWTWKRIDFEPDAFEELSTRFEVEFYRAALKSERHDVELLLALGSAYSRLGDIERSLEVDRMLVEARPDEPVFHYNLACGYSLTGQLDAAFAALQSAIKLGYANLEHLEMDRDLDNLKRDRRFREIIEQLEPNFES